jgi:hypothetical protein
MPLPFFIEHFRRPAVFATLIEIEDEMGNMGALTSLYQFL